MSVLIENKQMLKARNKVWDQVSNILQKIWAYTKKSILKKVYKTYQKVYTKKYLKTKINSYRGKINTNFYDKMSEKDCHWY